MKITSIGFLLFLLVFNVSAQTIKSPDEFLGYELGTEFTFHHRAVEYFKYIAENSAKAKYISYGNTYEGRPLGACIVSSEENLKNLEEYRKNNLIKTGLLNEKFTGKQLLFVWLSYNVHGDEAGGMETAMKVLYTLITGSDQKTMDWFNSCIFIIDPCENPDGRDLYTNTFKKTQNIEPNPDKNAAEHHQERESRLNHYFFDLNRDWCWQTQTETRQRLAFYNQYMPQVHADFHEMGAESTSFFAPGAEPWNESLTKWQREFHNLMGKENAKMFDKASKLYYTNENFDLFSPIYGDTWPLINGAMGFTYEQGGGGAGGLSYIRESGDTLTLKERIKGHFLSSIATITASYENKDKLIDGFNRFFEENNNKPPFAYKSFVIKADNSKSNIKSLLELLDRNQIKYSYVAEVGKKLKGFNYAENKTTDFTLEKNDILVSAYQPQSRIVNVLFEPISKASDSLSYDISAWALPYVFNLKTFAVSEKLNSSSDKLLLDEKINEITNTKPFAYLVNFYGFDEIRFLAELYKSGLRPRYSFKPFTMNGKNFNRGSVMVTRGDNRLFGEKFDQLVTDAANKTQVTLIPASSGLSDKGNDLGSDNSIINKRPQVAIICGDGINRSAVGSLWYFFERELSYPVSLIETDYASRIDFSKYDIIILPSGDYTKLNEKLFDFAKNGGRLVAIDKAMNIFAEDKSTELFKAIELQKSEKKDKEKKIVSGDSTLLRKFEFMDRYWLTKESSGSIYKVNLDDTNPFAFGLGKQWFILKNNQGFPYLENGYNIGYITDKEPVSGFAGFEFKQEVKNTNVIASEKIGKGEVIYISDDPYFRAFWKSGRVLIGNLIFR